MNAISLLQRDIVKYIYDQGWPALRPIQEAAIKHGHETDANLILAAPTASGKTEAAFLPAINSVNNWTDGVKIVYISPLIALINDQFKRTTELCEYLDIPVTSWHGESSRSGKDKLIKDPRGILLITPESIEAMLVRRPGEAAALFAGTEWVIIDELHSFLDTSRGNHLKALLARIATFNKNPTRYIGMTATLNRNSYAVAKNFFPSRRESSVLLDSARNDLSATIMYRESESINVPAEIIDDIFTHSTNERMLVFPNSRGKVEEVAVGLKRRAKKYGNNVRYFAHHASVDKELRLEAEEFAKTSTQQLFTICCTSTLELGIDIGSVDSVAQIEAAPSVASLAQRLGRSGRTKRHSILHIYASRDWSLLQSLASLELYKEGAVEETEPIRKPYSVLLQQILSLLVQYSGLSREDLIAKITSMHAWGDIDDGSINKVIDHLIEIDYIEDVDGVYVTGMSAQRAIESRDFYAHFESKVEFKVVDGHGHIGEMPLSLQTVVGANVYLAAKIWKIKDIDLDSKKIYVVPAQDGKPPKYDGGGGDVSHLLRRRMLKILQQLNQNKTNYDSDVFEALNTLAKDSLTEDGQDFLVIRSQSNPDTLMTFAGTRINKTLLLMLEITANNEVSGQSLQDVSSSIHFQNVETYLEQLKASPLGRREVASWLLSKQDVVTEMLRGIKYLDLLPQDLRVDYLMSNYFDIEATDKFIQDSGRSANLVS